MSEQPDEGPIVPGEPVSEEAERLVALFDEIEKGQLDFLDGAGKRIIELSTGLLGILFAVASLSGQCPPPCLKNNEAARWFTLLALIFFLAAIGTALWAVQPREYPRYRYDVTKMKKVLQEIRSHKLLWVKVAGVLFGLAAVALTLLVGTIILTI